MLDIKLETVQFEQAQDTAGSLANHIELRRRPSLPFDQG
jgi:hypothetical protein